MIDEWDDCSHCDGSGRDESMWDGRCVFCRGSGQVIVVNYDDEPDDAAAYEYDQIESEY